MQLYWFATSKDYCNALTGHINAYVTHTFCFVYLLYLYCNCDPIRKIYYLNFNGLLEIHFCAQRTETLHKAGILHINNEIINSSNDLKSLYTRRYFSGLL